jgi:hypothetical protein
MKNIQNTTDKVLTYLIWFEAANPETFAKITGFAAGAAFMLTISLIISIIR